MHLLKSTDVQHVGKSVVHPDHESKGVVCFQTSKSVCVLFAKMSFDLGRPIYELSNAEGWRVDA